VIDMSDEKALESRRDFLKLAALGTVGSLSLPEFSNANAATSSATPKTVSVIGVVNVSQALADNSLINNVYWMDNNGSGGSQYIGTDHLNSAIAQGAAITWIVSGLEVESVVNIADITGPAANVSGATFNSLYNGALNYWVGQINAPASGSYSYNIVLKVENRLMIAPSPLALKVQ